MRYTINEIKNKTAPIAKAYGIERMSGNEILSELAESRAYYQAGGGEDFGKVLDEIAERYGI